MVGYVVAGVIIGVFISLLLDLRSILIDIKKNQETVIRLMRSK